MENSNDRREVSYAVLEIFQSERMTNVFWEMVEDLPKDKKEKIKEFRKKIKTEISVISEKQIEKEEKILELLEELKKKKASNEILGRVLSWTIGSRRVREKVVEELLNRKEVENSVLATVMHYCANAKHKDEAAKRILAQNPNIFNLKAIIEYSEGYRGKAAQTIIEKFKDNNHFETGLDSIMYYNVEKYSREAALITIDLENPSLYLLEAVMGKFDDLMEGALDKLMSIDYEVNDIINCFRQLPVFCQSKILDDIVEKREIDNFDLIWLYDRGIDQNIKDKIVKMIENNDPSKSDQSKLKKAMNHKRLGDLSDKERTPELVFRHMADIR